MSAGEILSRSKLASKKYFWRRRSSWNAPPPKHLPKPTWHLPDINFKATEPGCFQNIIEEADNVLNGHYRLLNVDFGEEKVNWYLDPVSGRVAPLKFGLDIDYRDYDLVGNVKNIWEKSRHHHLTVIALAYAMTGNVAYSNFIELQLSDWVQKNPPLSGINWSSSLEFGVRLISWTWIERLIRSSTAHEHLFGADGVLWTSIYWHQWLISQYYSPGSSANNHLIGEMAGLFISAYQWPVFPESSQWQGLSRESLEKEIHRQTFPSGLNREQAFSYQIFSLEFFLLAGLEGERFGAPFSSAYLALTKKMFEIIPQVTDIGGNLPNYGDEDNGMALQLRPLSSDRLSWLYRLGTEWLGANLPDLPETAGAIPAAVIGAGIKDQSEHHSATNFDYKPVGLEEEGLYLLASDRGTSNEIFCLADAGPVGFLSIAAHGHADALSFALSVGGTPVIVDPGTYTYHAEPAWRSYFKSTKAHNTVEVDGVSQSESAGIFLWTRKASCKVLSWQPSPKGGTLVAQHNGYTRLPQKVLHQRELTLKDRQLVLCDELRGDGVHDVEWRLHFSPICDLRLSSEVCTVKWSEGSMDIRLDPQLKYSVIQGESDGGWFSAGFNLKEAAYTLVGKLNTEVPISLEHSLEILL
ncbi:MAG: alginate lyase family protein [Elainellaceae cyanobacterium]